MAVCHGHKIHHLLHQTNLACVLFKISTSRSQISYEMNYSVGFGAVVTTGWFMLDGNSWKKEVGFFLWSKLFSYFPNEIHMVVISNVMWKLGIVIYWSEVCVCSSNSTKFFLLAKKIVLLHGQWILFHCPR